MGGGAGAPLRILVLLPPPSTTGPTLSSGALSREPAGLAPRAEAKHLRRGALPAKVPGGGNTKHGSCPSRARPASPLRGRRAPIPDGRRRGGCGQPARRGATDPRGGGREGPAPGALRSGAWPGGRSAGALPVGRGCCRRPPSGLPPRLVRRRLWRTAVKAPPVPQSYVTEGGGRPGGAGPGGSPSSPPPGRRRRRLALPFRAWGHHRGPPLPPPSRRPAAPSPLRGCSGAAPPRRP